MLFRSKYEKHFKTGLMEDFPVLQEWMEQGFIQWKEDGKEGIQEGEKFLALTETGLGLSDYLGPQLISDEIRKAMEEWEEMHGQPYDII